MINPHTTTPTGDISKCPYHQMLKRQEEEQKRKEEQQKQLQEELLRQEEQAKLAASSTQQDGESGDQNDDSPFRDTFADEFENEGLGEAEKTYKKLHKMLLLISNFYKRGQTVKTESSTAASEVVIRLRVDEQMAKKQLETLELNNAWKGLLKFDDLRNGYTDDVSRIAKEIDFLQTHIDSAKEAIERNKKITTVRLGAPSSLFLQLPSAASISWPTWTLTVVPIFRIYQRVW